ncbi:MAG: hypothetical protein WDN08_14225 [Rhizomicrobium sp.]
MDPQADLFDKGAGPDLGDQFPVADDLAGVLDQDRQDVEGAGAQLDRLIALLEYAFRGKQPERPESDDVPGMMTGFLKHRCRYSGGALTSLLY